MNKVNIYCVFLNWNFRSKLYIYYYYTLLFCIEYWFMLLLRNKISYKFRFEYFQICLSVENIIIIVMEHEIRRYQKKLIVNIRKSKYIYLVSFSRKRYNTLIHNASWS